MTRQAPHSHLVAPPSAGGRSLATTRGLGRHDSLGTSGWSRPVAALLAIILSCAGTGSAEAQFLGGQAVGGISIDADGIVRNVDAKILDELSATRRKALAGGGPKQSKDGLRKVSLARLTKAVEAAAAGTAPLPADVALMGGLERITHVFVDPDGHDIVLAGPADAARVDAAGNVLGASSGRPLLQLEDFIVALRAVDGAREGGMLCSIDPPPSVSPTCRSSSTASRPVPLIPKEHCGRWKRFSAPRMSASAACRPTAVSPACSLPPTTD